jgi:hypothetical protein
MIQRIQTLYLIIASVAISLMFFFPIAGYYGDLHTFQFSILGMKNMAPGAEMIFTQYFTLPLVFFVVCILIVTITIILLFKNRKKQLKLIKVDILLNIILIIGIFILYSRVIQSTIEVSESFKAAVFFPIISLIFIVLSFRSVKKDENLVRSADRLR